MELKEQLLDIFHNNYPGVESFIRKIVIPVFGGDIDYVNRDFIDDEQYRVRAQRAGISRLLYVADITEQNYNSNQIALFDVTLDDSVNIERARVNIQSVIRSIVMHHSHILILFHYENPERQPWRFSYAYKQSSVADTTSARRYTYVFGRDYSGRTAADRFCMLATSERSDADFVKAFSVEALSDEFFDRYRTLYADFVEFITDCRYAKHGSKWEEEDYGNPDPQFQSTFGGDKKLVRDYVKKMFGRIVFLYFLQRKGWLAGNLNYMHDLYVNSEHKDSFLDDVLEPLFFEVLNTDRPYRTEAAKALPGSEDIPYLNGGLFAQDDIDQLPCVFPRRLFDDLFGFLDGYNFTINENDSEDAEIGIDPEMLGRIFENLLEDNKDKGAFYTPKEIVDYMCRESIIAYLQDDRFTDEGNKLIREFIETIDGEKLSEKQRKHLYDKLRSVKICDPAIGSGAFPMGMVSILSRLRHALNTEEDNQKNINREVIRDNIYGVDIESGAVDIARLRFWLAIVIEETKPSPLPNLHFKIMQGNSLNEAFNGQDLSDLTLSKSSRIAKSQIEGTQYTLEYVKDEERKMLVAGLRSFYSESEHYKRDSLLNDIKNNIIRQLDLKGIEITEGFDPSANDKFFLWHTWFSDVFENGGFDIVIGNPPYISHDAIPYSLNRNNFDVYEPFADLYCYFFEKGLSLLKNGGILVLITSNSFLRANYGLPLRKFLLRNTPLSLIDLGDSQVFQNATVNVVISLIQRGISNKLCKVTSSNWDYGTLSDYTSHCYKYSKEELEIQPWTLISPKLITLRKKIESNNPTLEYLNTKIRLGLATGYNDAFIIDEEKRNQLIEIDVKNADLIKSVIRGRDIQRYYHQSPLYIILTPNGVDVSKYPSVYEYLDGFGDKFKSRGAKGRHWTNLRACSFIEDFKEEKIIWLELTDNGRFSISEKEEYLLNSAYFLLPPKGVNPRALLGILNSKLMCFYLHQLAATSGMGTHRWINNYVKLFPIAIDKEIHNKIAKIVSDILIEIKGSMNFDISAQEIEIDKLVYHLYGLTYDEVLIVDPDTPISREEYEYQF